MNVGYVKKEQKPYRFIDKIKYFLGIVGVHQFEQGYVFKIPVLEKEKSMDKIVAKLLKKIKKVNIDKIVFSNNIVDSIWYLKIEDELHKNNKDILNGRKLMKYMNYEIFEHILDLQKTKMNEQDIYFLVKKDKNLDINFLTKFVENCKTVNIVTNDIEKYKGIQENLYLKENILIGVSNNKNKALKRAKYIFNLNMTKKDMEKFKINRNAIIVNFENPVIYNNSAFDGINVNYFNIDIPDEYIERFEDINEMEEFDNTKLYEIILLNKIEKYNRSISNLDKKSRRDEIVRNIIQNDNIKIIGLVGNKGEIDENEIIKNYKITTS